LRGSRPVLWEGRGEIPLPDPITANAKRQYITTMTEQKRIYERIIDRVTDQFVKLTIGLGKENEKVLFFADPHFLFSIPDADLAHCFLPANALPKRQGKSQRAKLQTHLVNR
jgi:hypothetical protein